MLELCVDLPSVFRFVSAPGVWLVSNDRDNNQLLELERSGLE
jgi:hypothetical protein